ncbi:MAG: efflux RND transporter periplasmic adaptor subunit, partial [Candidatus Tectomicrobia bacterium]|nr:efflux RND transporter periplasmic adaptor subunit [Candidatus Tectomicrobia bacterium]
EEFSAKLALAKANLLSAIARLNQTKAGVDMQRSLIENEKAQSKVNLDNAERNYERTKALFASGLTNQKEIDRTKQEYDIAKSRYDVALSNEAQNTVKAYDVAAAEAVVKQMGASLELAEIQLKHTLIKAPFPGVISKVHVTQGELIGVGAPIATLVDLSDLYIKAVVDEADTGKIKVGQPVKVTLDAYPYQTFLGKLTHISPVISIDRQENRTAEIKVLLVDDRLLLKPGMSADIEIIVDKAENVLYVPTNTILDRGGKKLVFSVDGASVSEKPVEIGVSNWDYTEIMRGVSVGERIIDSIDIVGLKPGRKVQVISLDGSK